MASPIKADYVQSDTNSQIDHVQAPRSSTTYDLLSGTNVEVGQGVYAGMQLHHDERSSRAKMWDPVKDCGDPNTTPVDLSALLPDGQLSQQLRDRQQSTISGFGSTSPMGPPPRPQSHTMVLGHQGRASMGSQTFQGSHSYDQSRRRPHQLSGHEDVSALDRLVSVSLLQNRQRSLESIPRGAALLYTRPRRPNHLNRHSQENERLMEPRMPVSMVSNVTCPQRPSPYQKTQVDTAPLATGSEPSTQRRSDQITIVTGHDPQQADISQHQSLLTTTAMSQALSMGRHGESLDQQSNYKDAVRVYEHACALLQEVIIRSPSFEERMECDLAVSQ